jgi:putative hydrolase of the HAD superfamily
MARIKTVGFDADDTLWHNERIFGAAQLALAQELSQFATGQKLAEVVLAMQQKNVPIMGYGIKSFTISMMDAALDVSNGELDGPTMAAVLDIGREMMAHPIDLLPGVEETLEDMSRHYDLVLITKGDLIDQERKVQVSDLSNWFRHIEIVSEKMPDTYQTIFGRMGEMDCSAMVGNSVKSDVLPAVHAGAWGIHVPYETTWEMEVAEPLYDHDRYLEADDILHAAEIIRSL